MWVMSWISKLCQSVFCPVIFRFKWVFTKYSNGAFCQCLACFSPGKVFRIFLASQVLRNYLLSKNISVNKSIIWLSHQVSDTFYHFIHTFSPLEARSSVFLSFYVTKFCFWNGELKKHYIYVRKMRLECHWMLLIHFAFDKRRCNFQKAVYAFWKCILQTLVSAAAAMCLVSKESVVSATSTKGNPSCQS